MLERLPVEGLAAAYLISELTKFLVTNLSSRAPPKGGPCFFGETERFQLAEVYNSVQDNQKETLGILHEIATSQRETAKIMERVLSRLEK